MLRDLRRLICEWLSLLCGMGGGGGGRVNVSELFVFEFWLCGIFVLVEL